jgi:hypothetical protein
MGDFWRFANERFSYEERLLIHRTTLAVYAKGRSVKLRLNELSYEIHWPREDSRRRERFDRSSNSSM